MRCHGSNELTNFRPVELMADAPSKPSTSPGEVLAAPAAPGTTEEKDWLSSLLERTKPYRELAAIFATVIVSVSGAVAWVVAHFATQAELHYLECRVTNNVLTQLLPIHMEEFAGKIDWRAAQIKVLAHQGGGTPEYVSAAISDLSDQMTALTKEQKDAAAKLQNDIDNINKNCISETPKVGSAK
jgi:hypothetical protein